MAKHRPTSEQHGHTWKPSLQDRFPGVEFTGDVTLRLGAGDSQGAAFDLGNWPLFRALIQEAYEPTRSSVEWPGRRIDAPLEDLSPRFVFDLGGYPEAATRPALQRSITISLGLLLALGSTPRLFRTCELLVREVEHRKRIEFDELRERYLDPDPALLDELVSLLSVMHRCSSDGWRSVPWSYENATTVFFIDGEPMWPGRSLLHMARLTSFHEVGHWHMEKLMSQAGRARLEADTRFGLEEWLSARDSADPDRFFATPRFLEACREGLADAKTSASWVREICADQLAVAAVLSAADARLVDGRMRWHADIALYFFALELQELFQEWTGHSSVAYPPARLRRSFTAFVLRMRTGQTETQFLAEEWSIGCAVTAMTRFLKAAMSARLEEDPAVIERPPLPFLIGVDQ